MFPQAVLLGALANVAGSSVYVRDTLRGTTKPNRMTFLLWGIAPLIAAAASWSAGVTWAAVPVLVSALCPLAIFITSFLNANSYWRLRPFDYFCGTLSIVALIVWFLTSDPNIAIAFAIASDGLAGMPTLIKAWRYPETETGWGYVGAAFSGLTSFAAAADWNFSSLAFPAYLFVITMITAFGVFRRRIGRAGVKGNQ